MTTCLSCRYSHTVAEKGCSVSVAYICALHQFPCRLTHSEIVTMGGCTMHEGRGSMVLTVDEDDELEEEWLL